MAGLDYTAQELGTVLQAATATSVHSSRRHVFHLVTDVASVVKLATRVWQLKFGAAAAVVRPLAIFAPCGACDIPPMCEQGEVCSAQDQLERVFIQLLSSPLKLICTPIQVTLAECYVSLFEWGDSRKLPDAVHNLLKVLVSKADTSNRVCVAPWLQSATFRTRFPIMPSCAPLTFPAVLLCT